MRSLTEHCSRPRWPMDAHALHLQRLAGWLVLQLWILQVHCQQDTTTPFSLDPPSNVYRDCYVPDGRLGKCVHSYECLADNKTISVQIFASDLREGQTPLRECGRNLWCCSHSNATAPSPTVPAAAAHGDCPRVPEQRCPWCAALYRPGGDESRRQRLKSGLYCAGVLVGKRVVLTSATCVRTTSDEITWVRVPASADPARNYSVVNRVTHENYHSATHANDFGLLVLNEDVQWPKRMQTLNGNCIELETQLQGECTASGFTEQEELVMTAVTVRSGRCTRRYLKHMISDDACGTVSETPCPVVPGAPVFCPTAVDGQGGLVIAGVARLNCIGGTVLLGKLQQHASWLLLQLKRIGL